METGGSSSHEQTNVVPTKVESHGPTKSSEDVAGGVIQIPPVQVMERPGETNTSPDYTFPSHVFSKSTANSQVEWSTASNESLFSIYMGNTSFSNDLGCFKSWEMDKPGDVCAHDQPYASPNNNNVDASTNKFNAISKRTHELQNELSSKNAEARAAETMREVIMESSKTTENVGKGDDKAFEPQRQSNDSTNSYAFQQPSKGPEKSVSSLSAAEKQEQESSNTADQAPKPTTNTSNGWSCFSCCGF
ncbi:uncharacterized protein LOC114179870 isoform X2 [Vigna unguiculata]|uniref:uncharacterized protein LOC114179870 isoform X2 n=1 Tax=Vigna unguiculata TaxID=3917 RepID=UPI0010161EDB|nr:uncharacterized protein LOC114179870 isoform X2 [Vigna unguiculata]